MALQCPIKLNLALSVGPINDSGMHPLSSWMVAFSLGDDLLLNPIPHANQSDKSLKPLGSGITSRIPPELKRRVAKESYAPLVIDWPVQSDLVYRAIELLVNHQKAESNTLGLEAELIKRIPPGTGLGAGSSDAAMALIEGNRLLHLGLTQAELRELASSLGSDVPFFIHTALGHSSCIATGTGTSLEPIDLKTTLHAVLILPNMHSATSSVYQAFDEAPTQLDHKRICKLPAASTAQVLNQTLWNDLTQAAFSVCPTLQSIQARAQEIAKQPVHLTGSGSALFTLMENASSAENLAEAFCNALDLPALAIQSVSNSKAN